MLQKNTKITKQNTKQIHKNKIQFFLQNKIQNKFTKQNTKFYTKQNTKQVYKNKIQKKLQKQNTTCFYKTKYETNLQQQKHRKKKRCHVNKLKRFPFFFFNCACRLRGCVYTTPKSNVVATTTCR